MAADLKVDRAAKDNAVDLLENVGHTVTLTPEDNARVLRKIDLRLLPIVLCVYFLQALDKTTLAYASVFGLIEDVGLHGLQYSWLGSVVYLAQLAAQPLVAYLLVKLPLGKFLAGTVFLWGTTLACMTAAKSFPGLLVARMFLGAFEAGVGMFRSQDELGEVDADKWCSSYLYCSHADVVAPSRTASALGSLVCHERHHEHGMPLVKK